MSTTYSSVRKAIPGLEWVDGHGDWALIAWCDVPTVSLWPTEAEAEQAKAELRYCGHACTKRHEVRRMG